MPKIHREDRFFQWIDGEDAGKVVKLEDIDVIDGQTFYCFDDGEMCNMMLIAQMTCKHKDLTNKFMVEVKRPEKEYLWDIRIDTPERREIGDNEFMNVPTVSDIVSAGEKDSTTGMCELKESSVGKRRIVPPVRFDQSEVQPLPKFNWFYSEGNSLDEVRALEEKRAATAHNSVEMVNVPSVEQSAPKTAERAQIAAPVTQQPLDMTDDEKAIAILVNKSKKHDTEITLSIHMNLPSKRIYEIATSEFDNGGEIFVNEVIKSLTHEQITAAIASGLKEAYSSNPDEDN